MTKSRILKRQFGHLERSACDEHHTTIDLYLSGGYAKLVLTTTKGSKQMANLEIGQTITTKKSKVTGVVQEVVKNANGSLRVRLELPNGNARWTTIK